MPLSRGINKNPAKILTKEFLEEQYVHLRKTVSQIADEFDIKSQTSVHYHVKKYKLKRKSLKNSASWMSRKYLLREYVIRNKSLVEIAKEVGFRNQNCVKKALIKHKIPLRTKRKHSQKFTNFIKRLAGHKYIPMRYWYSVLDSARKRGIEVKITIDYAWNLFKRQKKRCAISGVEISIKVLGAKAVTQTASLDRIDSSKPYIKGNLQWIHKDIQRMKWNSDETKFFNWCKIIAEYQANKT